MGIRSYRFVSLCCCYRENNGFSTVNGFFHISGVKTAIPHNTVMSLIFELFQFCFTSKEKAFKCCAD